MNSVSPSQHPSPHSNLLLHAKPGTHVPAPSGPLTPKPTAVFPVSLSSYFDHIIRTGSNCTYTFGFSYIFLSVSGALYFHSGLSKAVCIYIRLLSYWEILCLYFTAVEFSLLGIFSDGNTYRQTGLWNMLWSHSCPKRICYCSEHVPLHHVTNVAVGKHTPTPCMTRGSPLSEEYDDNSKTYIYNVKIEFYFEIRSRSMTYFILVCIITLRCINCHHCWGGGKRGEE